MQHNTLLITMLTVAGGFLAASEADVWYSERGIASTGVTIAQDLVTEWWDIPAGVDLMEVGKIDGRRGTPPRGWDALIAGKKPGTQKNIVWRVELPHWGHNGAIVINEKVFLLYEDGYKADAPMLLCLDVHSGHTLWEQAIDPLDTLPPSEQTVAKEARRIEHQRFRDYMHWWNKLHWDNNQHRERSKKEKAAILPTVKKEADAAGWIFKAIKTPNHRGVGVKLLQPGDMEGMPKDQALIDNYRTVCKNRWLLRQHWTAHQPWYGNTHGSVVSDGTHIYAVTGQGGVAAFDLDGKKLWTQWINPEHNFYRSNQGVHGNIQSPVLVDNKLIYFHRDSATLFAFDKVTGTQAFATRVPEDPNVKKGAKYHNFFGHIGPGSTTIVLRLDGVPVGIAGNGMVVRLTDGKILGLVEGKIHSYLDMAGKDDIYVTTFKPEGKAPISLGAVRLGIDGDKLTQKRLWLTSTSHPEGLGNWESAACVTIDGKRVLTKMRGKSNGGMCAFDLESGTVLASRGAVSNYYAFSSDHYITRSGRSNLRHRASAIVDSKTLKTVGQGLLVIAPPSGEIMKRNIAFNGQSTFWMGYSKPTAWGNRIFMRSNRHLWCIGDPKQKFTAPAPIGKQ